MTCESDPEIRRCADGTIDFAFYDARARALRCEAIVRSPFHMAARVRGLPRAIDPIAAVIRSVMVILASARQARAGKVRRADARCG